jgi:biotin carboxylase
MPRILLLLPTTTYRTEAFLSAAGQMDVEVTIGSEQPNTLARLNPTAFLTLSFHDPQQTARQVVSFAAKHPIDAVVAVDDQVTVVAATVCEALSLRQNSVESVLAAGNKHRMRQLFQRSEVPSPGFRLCRLDDDAEALADQLHYPCVVKPLDLSGSQGVIRVDDETEFVRAVDRLVRIFQAESGKRKAESQGSLDDTDFSFRIAEQRDQRPSQTDHFLVEDFISGPEVALEGLLSRGELHVLALFDKPDPMDGPFFEETIYLTPSRLPTGVQEQITNCTSQAVRALGLSEGPIHAELRLGTDGPSVIEVNARSIGGQCSRVLRFGVGISLEELIIRHALDGDFEPPVLECQPAGVMMIPIPQAGRLSEVRGLHEAESVAGIEGVTISAHVGQELLPLPEGSVYLGFLFARASSVEAVEAALREAHARLTFVIEPFDSNTEPANTPFLQSQFQS